MDMYGLFRMRKKAENYFSGDEEGEDGKNEKLSGTQIVRKMK
jgi:hypothetical protein